MGATARSSTADYNHDCHNDVDHDEEEPSGRKAAFTQSIIASSPVGGDRNEHYVDDDDDDDDDHDNYDHDYKNDNVVNNTTSTESENHLVEEDYMELDDIFEIYMNNNNNENADYLTGRCADSAAGDNGCDTSPNRKQNHSKKLKMKKWFSSSMKGLFQSSNSKNNKTYIMNGNKNPSCDESQCKRNMMLI